jgi:hypothetical protein
MSIDQHIILRGALTDTLLLFGDSYVQQYIPRFKKLSEDNVPNLMQIEAFTHGGCAPIPLVNRRTIRECLPFVERGFDLSMQPRVRRVLLGASWRGFLDRGDYFDPATDTAIDPSSEAGSFAWEGFQQRIAALVGAGKKVYLMLNPPWGKIADPASLARNYGGKKSISISQHNERQGPVNARLTKIAWRTGAIPLDPVSWLCNGDTCPVTTDSGEPIFKDAFHLRASYVRDLPVLDRYALP